MWQPVLFLILCCGWNARLAHGRAVRGARVRPQNGQSLVLHVPPKQAPLQQVGLRRPSDEVLKQTIITLENQVSSLQDDNKNLVRAVQMVMRNNQTVALKREIQSLRQANMAMQESSRKESVMLEASLRKETEKLNQEKSLVQQLTKENETLTSRDRTLEKQNAQLRSQLTAFQQQAKKLEQDSVRNLQEQLASTRKKEMVAEQKADKERAMLKSELDQATNLLHDEKTENTELRERGLVLLNETDTMRPQLATLKQQVGELAEDKKQVLKTLQGVLRENKGYKQRVDEYQKQVEKYKQIVGEGRDELNRYKDLNKYLQENLTAAIEHQRDAKRQAAVSTTPPAPRAHREASRPKHAMVKNITQTADQLEMMGDLAKIDAYISSSKAQLTANR